MEVVQAIEKLQGVFFFPFLNSENVSSTYRRYNSSHMLSEIRDSHSSKKMLAKMGPRGDRMATPSTCRYMQPSNWTKRRRYIWWGASSKGFPQHMVVIFTYLFIYFYLYLYQKKQQRRSFGCYHAGKSLVAGAQESVDYFRCMRVNGAVFSADCAVFFSVFLRTFRKLPCNFPRWDLPHA